MKITKLGHCCLLIEESGVKIITDPGAWTSAQNDLKDIHAVLITHEHQDHFHIDSVKAIIANNPEVKIYTNAAVGKLLTESAVPFELLSNGMVTDFRGIALEGHGEKHATIYGDYGQVENTGFLIGNKLFHPGDSFTKPNKPVEVLALPVSGPWMKISDAIDYAKEVTPKKWFPVHDGYLKIYGFIHNVVKLNLDPQGIEMIDSEDIKTFEV
jgi:L-ascorbate metabolism protein UlaG (beta-lactamase superfamily)